MAALRVNGCIATIGCLLLAVIACAAPVGGWGSPGTAGAPPTSTPATTTTPPSTPPPSASRPNELSGPGDDATVVATVLIAPGFFCPVTDTHVASLTAYSDGTVLIADGIGAFCEPVPTITIGWIDPARLHSRLDDYFASDASRADVDVPDVTDLPTTVLIYCDGSGAAHRVAAYGLSFDSPTPDVRIPEDVADAQRVLAELLDALEADAAASSEWVPATAVAVADSLSYPGASDATAVAWPLPASAETAEVAELLAGSTDCVAFHGYDAATLVAAAKGRPTAYQRWSIEGSDLELAIGIVLPGTTPCER